MENVIDHALAELGALKSMINSARLDAARDHEDQQRRFASLERRVDKAVLFLRSGQDDE